MSYVFRDRLKAARHRYQLKKLRFDITVEVGEANHERFRVLIDELACLLSAIEPHEDEAQAEVES